MKWTRYGTVSQLTFLPRIFPVNCYLVEEEDGLTLVDCALPYSAKGILATAERIGKPITRIVITHAHDDHVGALDKLKQALPQAPVYIAAREARILSGDTSLDRNEPAAPLRGGLPRGLATRADVLLHDGDRVGSLLTVAAPGHSPGMTAFLDTRNAVLLAGDAYVTRGGIAVSGTLKLGFPFPAWATWHKPTALASARRLLALSPSLLACGHGPMLSAPGAAMERAIMEAERRLAPADAEESVR
ncbi:hypothetical protein SY83_07355 [Paenibacillus swuensis]|uniref:Metallo-beta-lactamase domain-containing protein n=1 Tax=Paenibacillus swuensis TaxID=1178515 RepID=A0A172TGQ6_9BACL|nr:MBL fold metallo-hydrolase [Paenibacillus swuensis]ANE46126.1 hypothetical protein SY83_07355 [Paenibacillus swuensis]